MKTSSGRIKVQRNGKDAGEYRLEQIFSLSETGHLSSSDMCYDEAKAEWIPVPEFLATVNVPKYAAGTPATEEDLLNPDEIPPQHPLAIISGWIAFLLAIAALIGVIFWSFGKDKNIAKLKQTITVLEQKLAEKNTEYQRLLFASREVAEPNVVRGRIILRTQGGTLLPRPKVTVQLYPRKVIEDYLAERFRIREASPPALEGVAERAAFFIKDLPPALKTTTTDASGRYEFPIAEPGEYVIYCSMTRMTPEGLTLQIWFLAFDSQAPLNTAVDLTETNSVSQFVPGFMITDAR